MAELAPRLDIPAAFHALDEACYEDGGPTSAFEGKQTGRNDRRLHAVQRHCVACTAFFRALAPQVWQINPQELPTIRWRASAWARRIDIWVRATITPAAGTVWTYASTRGRTIEPPSRAARTAIVDGGAGAETTYQLSSLRPQPILGGEEEFLRLWFCGSRDTTSGVTGQLTSSTGNRVVGAAGAFAGLPAAPNIRRVVRLLDGNGKPMSGFHNVVDHNGDNTLFISPEWREGYGEEWDYGNYAWSYGVPWQWELMTMSAITIFGITAVERSLTGRVIEGA